MKKHLKQNMLKLMQRGGGCSSYHATIPVVVEPASVTESITNQELENALSKLEEVINILSDNSSTDIDNFCNNVTKYIIDPATTSAELYTNVAAFATGIDTEPSAYIIEIGREILRINDLITPFLQNIRECMTNVLRQYDTCNDTVSYDSPDINYSRTNDAKQTTVDIVIELIQLLYNLCSVIIICIILCTVQVCFLNKVASIYSSACNNVNLATAKLPPPTVIQTDTTEKWDTVHMTENAKIDYHNASIDVSGTQIDNTAYKTALNAASTPGTTMVKFARTEYATHGRDIIDFITKKIEHNSINDIYIVNKSQTTTNYKIYIDLINNIIEQLKSINIKILLNNANAAISDSDKILGRVLYNNAVNDDDAVIAGNNARKNIVDNNTAIKRYKYAFDDSNNKYDSDHITIPTATEGALLADITLLCDLNTKLESLLKQHLVAGGARRHKKSLSLKKNKMHKRTKQNHKSRKTYNTHNTRNTQQRKKHNKQKSHKNKHM